MWNAEAFESGLKSFTEAHLSARPARLRDAIAYSLFSGGKRVRPRLLMAAAESLGVSSEVATRLGIGLELIHTYTLIHDDLPAMDDDDFRRGKPTLHRAYDEATALLAGDALITLGFDAILTLPGESPASTVTALKALSEVAGPRGVIAGQLMETESKATLEDWLHTASLKTGALFQACFTLPAAFVPNAPSSLQEIGLHFGLAFQIADDLEDPLDQAMRDPKNIVSLEGADASRKRALSHIQAARSQILALPRPSALQELLTELERKASS